MPSKLRAITQVNVDHPQASVTLLIGPWENWMKFKHVIFKQILVIDGWSISCEIALILMSLDFTDDQSTLVQVP